MTRNNMPHGRKPGDQDPWTQLTDKIVHDEGRGNPGIQRNSMTWLAVRKFIEDQVKADYLPLLRKKGMDHGGTEYARGAMDAFDSLLQFGGEEV